MREPIRTNADVEPAAPGASSTTRLAALLALVAVAAGAFGAHGLEGHAAELCNTAARYQMYHALALLCLPLLRVTPGVVRRVRIAFVAGTVLFSGSLYALALTGYTKLGAVTPIGGVCFLAGWLVLALGAGGGGGARAT